MNWTHKGWFGLCPVYIAELDSGAPIIDPRHWSLLPLMAASEWIYTALFFVMSAVNADYQPAWPIRITGKIV